MSYSYNTSSSGGSYAPNTYSGGSYAPNTYSSSYTYANQQNNNWDDYEHEYYEQQYNNQEEDDQGEDQEEDQEDDQEEEEDDCQEEEEDNYQEEEAQEDNGYTELYRDDPIVGKCYFIAYVDNKDIDMSQYNNWKYYAPHNKLIYMGEFERLKSTGGGHTGSTTYYFSDGYKIAAEYTPLLCFLEA